jgi:hypothetical protein
MNASFEQPPSSPSELAAGAVALGVVALITIVGVSTSPPNAASPLVASVAPPPTVAREPDNLPTTSAGPYPAGSSQVIQASQSIQPIQPSEPSQDGPTSIASGTTVETPIAPAAQHPSRSAETTAALRVEAYIGIWAREPAECRNRAADDQRIRIDAHNAESGGGRCAFRLVRQENADSWRVRASCNAALESWTANISLRMVGPNLRWSSERGTETYVRCPSPPAPVRQAGAAR